MKSYLIPILYVLFISHAVASESNLIKHDVAISSDAESIAYSVYGSGSTTLIFIHGWSCDSRYWINQLGFFSENYKVITIDLGGHGNSSSNRNRYTINSFAKDIKAVVEKEEIDNIILIGHSMGGAVIASTLQFIPNKVKGIIGVDTLRDISLKMSKENVDAAVKPFVENYKKTMETFVASFFSKNTDADLKRWISTDMISASKLVAISAIRHFMVQFETGESSSIFENVNIPVISINSRLWPTNEEDNAKKIKNYQLIYIEETGHFPMLEKPQKFNALLVKAIQDIQAFGEYSHNK